METNIPQGILSTTDGEGYFKWFYATYESAFEALAEKGGVTPSLNLFDIRLNTTLGTEIVLNPNFRRAENQNDREAYILMLKLSNIWFSYEALLHACATEGLIKNPKSKIDALDDNLLHELEYSYNLSDIHLDFRGMNERITDDSKYRSDLQEYTLHLIRGATSREQKDTLEDVYNRFTNNDIFATKEALSFAYAVRNQYAHSGESSETGVKYISTKIAALRASYDFLLLFCLRLGELLIDKRISIISPVTK